MKRLLFVVALLVAAVVDGVVPENEDKAYGELYGLIVERIRLWPGLAPHETAADPGRYVFDEKNKVWRRHDVSCLEVVVLRPERPARNTLVVVMPGGGYSSQHMGHICRDARPILDSGRWVAVLHYRIPRREGRKIYDAPREDAARAIRVLRACAVKSIDVLPYVPYGIDKAHRLGLKVYEAPQPPPKYGPGIVARLSRFTRKKVRLP